MTCIIRVWLQSKKYKKNYLFAMQVSATATCIKRMSCE